LVPWSYSQMENWFL